MQEEDIMKPRPSSATVELYQILEAIKLYAIVDVEKVLLLYDQCVEGLLISIISNCRILAAITYTV